MPVTKDQVRATAALCRLDLSIDSARSDGESADEHISRIATQLDSVVGYIDMLDKVNTDSVEPLYSPLQHITSPREDRAEKVRTADEILANAPNRQQNFFAVPPVI